MDISTLIMMAVALALLTGVYLKSPEVAGAAVNSGVGLMLDVLPRMVAAFLIAGVFRLSCRRSSWRRGWAPSPAGKGS